MFSQVTQIGSIYQIPPAIDSLQWCKILPSDGNATLNASSGDDIDFDRLLPTLLEVFAIVFCGFLAGRCKLISSTDIKGLNDFTTYFTLPPLIFLNLVTINFQNVNWLFILSILVGKALVFLLVAVVTASVQRPVNLSYAGIYGIFCTQGNDFGLAYPIVASLYGSKRPLYPGYMYLIAPTSLLFLNPIGFVLMEIQKSKMAADHDAKQKRLGLAVFKTVGNVSWNILKNPIVSVTLLGVLGNFLFRGGLPSVLFGILQILSSAFSAAVLFLLGFSVARTSESKYSKKEGLLIPSVLLITKMLVSPLISRSTVSMLCANAPDVEDLADFGFLYGMVPTGPIVMLFAAEYGLRTEMMASTMVLCTGLFGPVVFILARMLSLKVRGIEEFAEELRMTMLVLSVLSFLSCVWIGMAFFLGKKVKKHLYRVTGNLMISQIVMALGIFVWSLFQSSEEWMSYIEIAFIAAGQLMSRVWVAILAVTLVFLRKDPFSPFVTSMFWPLCLGFGFPALVVIMILIVTGIGHCEPDLDNELPLFIYGTTEVAIDGKIRTVIPPAVGSIVVLMLCLATTSFCLVLYFRTSARKLLEDNSMKHSKHSCTDDIAVAIDKCKDISDDKDLIASAGLAIYKMKKSDSDLAISETERQLAYVLDEKSEKTQWDIKSNLKRSETTFSEKHLLSPVSSEASSFESSPTHRADSSSIDIDEGDDPSSPHLRHIILLILCCISMAVGLTISTWKLSTNQPNGLFVAMEFLDAVLNVGQGIFVFMVFIKDSKYILNPVTKWIRKVRHGVYSLNDPGDVAVDSIIQQLCTQFKTYHWENCVRDLPRTVKKNGIAFNSCFTGTEFVDWVIKVGLANHRTAAENYGQRLFRGNMLMSADGAVQFHDNIAYLYKLDKTED